jgi:hypothetical protein
MDNDDNTVPRCCEQPCELTGGYQMKDGRYVCWMHALVNAEYFNQTVGSFVALVPSRSLQ